MKLIAALECFALLDKYVDVDVDIGFDDVIEIRRTGTLDERKDIIYEFGIIQYNLDFQPYQLIVGSTSDEDDEGNWIIEFMFDFPVFTLRIVLDKKNSRESVKKYVSRLSERQKR